MTAQQNQVGPGSWSIPGQCAWQTLLLCTSLYQSRAWTTTGLCRCLQPGTALSLVYTQQKEELVKKEKIEGTVLHGASSRISGGQEMAACSLSESNPQEDLEDANFTFLGLCASPCSPWPQGLLHAVPLTQMGERGWGSTYSFLTPTSSRGSAATAVSVLGLEMKICFERKRRIREIKEQRDEASGWRHVTSLPAALQVLEEGAFLILGVQYG